MAALAAASRVPDSARAGSISARSVSSHSSCLIRQPCRSLSLSRGFEEASMSDTLSSSTQGAASPAPDTLELAALLCSRVCHDLISPVGAIVNGLEVMDDNPSAEDR